MKFILFTLALIGLIYTQGNSSLPDPPKCEIYELTIELNGGMLVNGKLPTLSDGFAPHELGELKAEQIFDTAAQSAYFDSLSIYSDVYYKDFSRGLGFLFSPEDEKQTVAMDDVIGLRIDAGYGCAVDSSFVYIFPRSMYELPAASIEAITAGQLRESYESEEVKCWYAHKPEVADFQNIESRIDEIVGARGWYSAHRSQNEELWSSHDAVLFCHGLIW